MSWINHIPVRSETSTAQYTVAELETMGVPTGTWGCSCPGWKRHGKCKHLTALNLSSSREREKNLPVMQEKSLPDDDNQWDEISGLINERYMTISEMEYLDKWLAGITTGFRADDAEFIIRWLRLKPARDDQGENA